MAKKRKGRATKKPARKHPHINKKQIAIRIDKSVVDLVHAFAEREGLPITDIYEEGALLRVSKGIGEPQGLRDLRFLVDQISPEIQRLLVGVMALALYRNQLNPDRRRIWNFLESFIRDFMKEPEFLERFGPDVEFREILRHCQATAPLLDGGLNGQS